jgi:SAM-dependent methyltransferase
MPLNDKQGHESCFWQSHVERNGGMDGYYAARVAEYDYKTRHFAPYWNERLGVGIDVGCGCISVLDSRCNGFLAIDPLMDHYRTFAPVRQCRNLHEQADIETIDRPGGIYSWAMCVNMIDHTPNPDIAIRQIYRILKPGGMLFFQVNFDDDFSPAHYALWNIDKVSEIVDSVFGAPIHGTVIRVHEDNQSQYWAVYRVI